MLGRISQSTSCRRSNPPARVDEDLFDLNPDTSYRIECSPAPRARRLLPLQRGTCSLCGGPDQRYHQCESVEGHATRFADLPPKDAALNTQARPAVRLKEAERVGAGRERQP